MQAFTVHTGLVMPLNRSNVDTDQILPKQFLKMISKTGYGPFAFDELRWLDRGEPGMDLSKRVPNPEFVMNQPRYRGVSILLTRKNFGCGSSREHAPWALTQAGFRCVIAPSFADIFKSNSLKNGLLTVQLSEETVDRLFDACERTQGYSLTVNLEKKTVVEPDGHEIPFELEEFRRWTLLNGLDDIGVTLSRNEEAIRAFEKKRLAQFPWLESVFKGE